MIIGIDEAGRGPWAGPLIVAGVKCADDFDIEGLNDSKLLSPNARATAYSLVCRSALDIRVAWASPAEIDRLGLAQALRRAFNRVYALLNDSSSSVIIDGPIRYVDKPKVTSIVRADSKFPAVMAASVVAKVLRDNYMVELDRLHPDYGFANHKGYGTAIHVQALESKGPIEGVHRMSFKPIARLIP